MAVLGAILLVVAYNMSEWRSFRALLSAPRSDVIVLLITFGLTVIVDLTVAIEVGMVLAAFLFMRRMAEVTNVSVITREFAKNVLETDPNSLRTRHVPPGVVVYEINGPSSSAPRRRSRTRSFARSGSPASLFCACGMCLPWMPPDCTRWTTWFDARARRAHSCY